MLPCNLRCLWIEEGQICFLYCGGAWVALSGHHVLSNYELQVMPSGKVGALASNEQHYRLGLH